MRLKTNSSSDGLVDTSEKKPGTDVPPFCLIDYAFLVKLANRCKLGVEHYGELAWNGMSDAVHSERLFEDEDFVLARIDHVINHAMLLRDHILTGDLHEDDDSGALAWGAMFLCAYSDWHQRRQRREDTLDAAEAEDALEEETATQIADRGILWRFPSLGADELQSKCRGRWVANADVRYCPSVFWVPDGENEIDYSEQEPLFVRCVSFPQARGVARNWNGKGETPWHVVVRDAKNRGLIDEKRNLSEADSGALGMLTTFLNTSSDCRPLGEHSIDIKESLKEEKGPI